jgi:hypothetical protein
MQCNAMQYNESVLTYSSLLNDHDPSSTTDKDIPTDWSTFPPTPAHVQCATPARLRKLYRDQLAIPEYQRLLQQNITIFGTFDGAYSYLVRLNE